MLNNLLLVAAIWPSSIIHDCKPLDNTIMVGIAENAVGDHLYCELISQPSPTTIEVSYVLHDKVIAEKKLNYAKSTTKPALVQKDFRFGELRQADVSEKNVELHYQANTNKKNAKAIIPFEKVDIVDAGFNNFIRENWDELQTGKVFSVNFASMPHLRTLPLRISKQPLEKCSNTHADNSSMVCFFIEIDNALLRMVLGNAKIIYDQHHRLYEFNGVVNVLDKDEDNQKAIIHYFYSSDYPFTAK